MDYLMVFLKKRLTNATTYIAVIGLVLLTLRLYDLLWWFFFAMFIVDDDVINKAFIKLDDKVKGWIDGKS